MKSSAVVTFIGAPPPNPNFLLALGRCVLLMNQGVRISSPNMPLTVQYVDTYQMMCLIARTPHSGTSGAKTASMET